MFFFSHQATDGKYSSNATVSITVNDVNNNAPVFQESQYHATILENSMRNTEVQSVIAHDSDSGSNAEVKYQILKGGFGDFHINEDTGVVYVSQKLDYDRHSNYSIEIIAFDAGSIYLFPFFFFFLMIIIIIIIILGETC